MKRLYILLFTSAVFFKSMLFADDGVTVGKFIIEPPTFHNAGFEWKISGDDNRNAAVAVQYREQGTTSWSEAQPMLRIGDEKVWRTKEFLEFWTPRMFAGSIFNLEEGKTYECRFEMSDPDGVEGDSVEEVSVTTRTKPKPYDGGRVLHVYPPGWEGPREEPAFTGLLQAYYGPGLGDWDVVWRRPVNPGDTILVHAGLYKADRRDYITPHQIPFHGSYVFTRDGTAEKPITIKAAGDGEVIFDGDNVYKLFDVMAADHHIFEGITLRNTEIAFYAGLKGVLGCSNLTVKNCRLEDVGIGVHNEWAGSKNFYITDNVMIGRDDHYRLKGWNGMPGEYGPSPVNSYYGVKVYGSGHVISHNKVSFFHDGVCISTYGLPEEDQDLKCVSIDIHNNDVYLSVDDFIETDGGNHNIRVYQNRGFNASHHGLSAQPMFGGPVYFIENLVYNVPWGGALKTGGANPAGVMVYNNTFIAENSNTSGLSNAHYRNNLFIGTNHPNKPVLRQRNYTSYTTTDYNGYRTNNNGMPKFMWAAPKGKMRDYDPLEYDSYSSLKAFQNGTGQEENGVLLEIDVFEKMILPDPSNPYKAYQPDSVDFRLRAGSAAVDAGVHLPNITDGYSGSAPDLGALEQGDEYPVYGPRE